MHGYPPGPSCGPAPTGLVLLRLTALDEVAAQQGEVIAQQLVQRLMQAIAAQRGPIVVLDVRRPYTRGSAARRPVHAALVYHPQTRWVTLAAGDDVTTRPDHTVVGLVRHLRWQGCASVRLGGCWAQAPRSPLAATAGVPQWGASLQPALRRQGISSVVDARLCAFFQPTCPPIPISPPIVPPPSPPSPPSPTVAARMAQARRERRAMEEEAAAQAAFLRFLLLF